MVLVCKCGHIHSNGGCVSSTCDCRRFRRAGHSRLEDCSGCEHFRETHCRVVLDGAACPVYPYLWDDEEYRRWIERVRLGSRPSYEKALELWIDFLLGRYGEHHTPKTLIDQIEEDRRQPRRQQGLIEDRLVSFHNWLLSEYIPRGVFGRGNRGRKKRGVSPKKAMVYIMALRSFYKHNGFPIRTELLSPAMLKPPSARPQNRQHMFTPDEIRRMIQACTNPRDRAIIAVKAQTLMDSSTLAYNFRYSTFVGGFKEDFRISGRNFLPKLVEALRSTEYPVHVRIERFKTQHVYDTFMGVCACRILADYLEEKVNTNVNPSLNDVVFTLYRHEGGPGEVYIKSNTRDVISELFRRLVRRLGIVSEAELAAADMNPARPHALRGSIATLLRENINSEIVEYWMGHRIDEKSLVYFLDLQARKDGVSERDRIEKMRELYSKYCVRLLA